MKVRTIVVGDFLTSCYVVSQEPSDQCLLIDAGYPTEAILDAIEELRLTPELLVITHGHIDHIAGSDEMRRAFPGLRLAASVETGRMLRRPSLNLSVLLGGPQTFPPPDLSIEHGETLEVAGCTFRAAVMGSLCLFAEGDPPVIFTGDTLFAGSIGRTDFPGGSVTTLLQGIQEHIMSLPDETVVYPGHGPCTTVGNERNNPFLSGGDGRA